MKLAAALGDNS